MAKHGDDRTGNLVCSFCGKSQDEVRKLIAGPTVYICDECIDLCNDIIAEECDQEENLSSTSAVPKPSMAIGRPLARTAAVRRSEPGARPTPRSILPGYSACSTRKFSATFNAL